MKLVKSSTTDCLSVRETGRLSAICQLRVFKIQRKSNQAVEGEVETEGDRGTLFNKINSSIYSTTHVSLRCHIRKPKQVMKLEKKCTFSARFLSLIKSGLGIQKSVKRMSLLAEYNYKYYSN